MTPTDVAALLYRAHLRAEEAIYALPIRALTVDRVAAFPWSDLDDATRACWIAVAEEAIKLAPALVVTCEHDDFSTICPSADDPYAVRYECRKCGRTRAA